MATKTPRPEATRRDTPIHLQRGAGLTVDVIDIDGYTFYASPRTGLLAETCPKCTNGSGWLREYAGIEGGRCFACDGTGTRGGFHLTVDAAREKIRVRRRDQAAAARRAERKAAREQAEKDAWVAANPELAAYLHDMFEAYLDAAATGHEGRFTRDEHVVIDLARGARTRPLTPAQTEFAQTLRDRISAEQDEQAARTANTKHLGTVGDVLTVTGKITVASSVSSWYGYQEKISRLIVLTTEDGDLVKMFTAARWAFEVKAGQTVTVTGKVREHGEYQGARQTELARPKVVTG